MFRYLTLRVSWFVAIGLATLAAPAQDANHRPGQPEPTAAQQELVLQLGEPSYLVRDAAAAELLRQGPAAKEALTEALTDPDLEIRTRAALILGLLETKEDRPADDTAERTREPGPTAVQRELVQQLGHPSFFLREEASGKLAGQGPAAKAVLMAALDDPDLEIRRRSRWILKRVLEDEFEARLEAFVADVEGTRQHNVPGWTRFRDLVGHGRDARKMFAAMTRSDGALLSAYESQSPELAELFADRAGWLQANLARSGARGPAVTPQAVATLLLIGADKTVKDHSRTLSQLYQLLNNSATKDLIEAADHPSLLWILLDKWVTAVSSTGSPYGIMMALKYELKETGLQQAKKLIEEKTPSSSMLHYAIITIGRFGGEDDVPRLTPLLENKTVCHRWSNQQLKKEGTINVEVRDAALVVILHLLGKDPKQYGFELLRDNPETLYYVYTFGFVEDSAREAAHAKWAKDSQAADG